MYMKVMKKYFIAILSIAILICSFVPVNISYAEEAPAVPAATASSCVDTSENSAWKAANVLDNDANTVWSSGIHGEANAEEWIMLDTGKECRIESATLVARVEGLGFPVDFEFQYSNDGITWSGIEGQKYTDYPKVASHQEINFKFKNSIPARYIRLFATKLRADGPNYLCQIADFKITTISKDITVDNPMFTNFKGEKVEKLVPGSFVRGSASITNNSAGTKSVTMIVALYNTQNRVEDIAVVEKNLGAGVCEAFRGGFNLPADTNGYYIKVLVWDSVNSMKPISNDIKFPDN